MSALTRKLVRDRFLKGGVTLWLLLGTMAACAQDTVDAVDFGTYTDAGQHSAPVKITYSGRWDFSGGLVDYEYYHSFFIFDLGGISAPVTEVSLELFVQRFFNQPSIDFKGVTIYEVTNDSATVAATHAASDPVGDAVYEDLGDGAVLGTGEILRTDAGGVVVLPLNQDAVNTINAHLGGTVTLGLRLDMHPGVEWNEYIRFWNSAGDDPARLQLQYGVVPAQVGTLAAGANSVTINMDNLTPGYTQTLQRATDATLGSWTSLVSFVPGTTETNWIDNAAPQQSAVYRLLTTP